MVTKRGTNGIHGAGYEYYFAQRHRRRQHVGQQSHAVRIARLHAHPRHPQQPLRRRFGRTHRAQEPARRQDVLLRQLRRLPLPAIGHRFEEPCPPPLCAPASSRSTRVGGLWSLQPQHRSGHRERHYLCARGLPGRLLRSARHRLQPAGFASSGRSTCRCPTTTTGGDHYNTQGYLSGIVGLPIKSNNYVARIDHDFSEKWRFMTSYRDYRYVPTGHTSRWISAARCPAIRWARRPPRAVRPQVPSLLGGRPDHQHHVPPPPTISASATCGTSGSGARPAAPPQLARPGRRARDRRRILQPR